MNIIIYNKIDLQTSDELEKGDIICFEYMNKKCFSLVGKHYMLSNCIGEYHIDDLLGDLGIEPKRRRYFYHDLCDIKYTCHMIYNLIEEKEKEIYSLKFFKDKNLYDDPNQLYYDIVEKSKNTSIRIVNNKRELGQAPPLVRIPNNTDKFSQLRSDIFNKVIDLLNKK